MEKFRKSMLGMTLLLPAQVMAHTGHGVTDGFMHGLLHPFGGLDHVCAMLAVGLWAAQMGGRSIWSVPLVFVGVMLLGGAVGMAGGSLLFAEQGIVLSVMLLGVLVAAAVRLPLMASSVLVGVFALCHGYVHGVEMPESAAAMIYASGFALATALLLGTGVLSAMAMQQWERKRGLPLAGAGIALCGVYLAVA